MKTKEYVVRGADARSDETYRAEPCRADRSDFALSPDFLNSDLGFRCTRRALRGSA